MKARLDLKSCIKFIENYFQNFLLNIYILKQRCYVLALWTVTGGSKLHRVLMFHVDRDSVKETNLTLAGFC